MFPRLPARKQERRPILGYPPLVWATSITLVEPTDDSLHVVGISPFTSEVPTRHWDAYDQYRETPRNWRSTRTGKISPHIRFANADTDDKLRAFVERFGPFVAADVREDFTDAARLGGSVLIADQKLHELRNERGLYSAALSLIAELRRGKTDIPAIQRLLFTIADKLSGWPAQWEREQRLREQVADFPGAWEFSEPTFAIVQELTLANIARPLGDDLSSVWLNYDPVRGAHRVLCHIVNAFRPLIYVWGKKPVEAPHWNLRYGIRPVLYHILRREYLTGVGIALCENNQCRELFEIERAGQRFCTAICSQRQRQRDYWVERGKKLRSARRERKRLVKENGGDRRGRLSSH